MAEKRIFSSEKWNFIVNSIIDKRKFVLSFMGLVSYTYDETDKSP